MSDDANNIDFTLDNPKTKKRRRMLFFKRPKGSIIPVGLKWTCLCGTVNVLNDKEKQYCADCGSCLQNQENLNPAHTYYTLVIVAHFNPAIRR